MNISKHLQKDYWVRRVTPDGGRSVSAVGIGYKPRTPGGFGANYVNLTQDDLLNEIEASAHIINSKFMSRRPIYGPTGVKDKDGKEEWAITGYDDLETVSLGLQKCIAMKKASHFAADGFWVSNETPECEDAYTKLCSWKDTVGLDTAFLEVVNSCFQTGDGAIYIYQTGTEIDYEVFSYLKGDRLYPGFTDEGTPAVYRQYTLRGKPAVDIFTEESRSTWVKMGDLDDNKNWFEGIRNWLRVEKGEVSEDGYRCIYWSQSQTGSGLNQCIYFRVPDIPSGPAQDSIEALERACSYVSEEVKGSAFPILFLKSEKIINLPPSRHNSKILGVKGTAETVRNSDARFLAPPDASNIATANIRTLTENILRSTMSVFVEPDILKAGADSSSSIKILFAPEVQWCQNMWIHFAKPVKQLIGVFKTLVGKVEEETTVFSKMRLSVGQNVWIPQNESERIKMELDQVYARVKSRRAAMADIGNQHMGDYEDIKKEWEEELDMKSRIPAQYSQTQAVEEETNPEEPKIDNNNKGKTIAER